MNSYREYITLLEKEREQLQEDLKNSKRNKEQAERAFKELETVL
jgi:hypothetical protein